MEHLSRDCFDNGFLVSGERTEEDIEEIADTIRYNKRKRKALPVRPLRLSLTLVGFNHFSRMNARHTEQFLEKFGDRMVIRCLEVIGCMNPKFWKIWLPYLGFLRHLRFTDNESTDPPTPCENNAMISAIEKATSLRILDIDTVVPSDVVAPLVEHLNRRHGIRFLRITVDSQWQNLGPTVEELTLVPTGDATISIDWSLVRCHTLVIEERPQHLVESILRSQEITAENLVLKFTFNSDHFEAYHRRFEQQTVNGGAAPPVFITQLSTLGRRFTEIEVQMSLVVNSLTEKNNAYSLIYGAIKQLAPMFSIMKGQVFLFIDAEFDTGIDVPSFDHALIGSWGLPRSNIILTNSVP